METPAIVYVASTDCGAHNRFAHNRSTSKSSPPPLTSSSAPPSPANSVDSWADCKDFDAFLVGVLHGDVAAQEKALNDLDKGEQLLDVPLAFACAPSVGFAPVSNPEDVDDDGDSGCSSEFGPASHVVPKNTRPKRACTTTAAILAPAAATTRPRGRVAAGGVAKKGAAKAFKPAAPPVYCAGPLAKFSDLEKALLITAIAQNRVPVNDRNLQGIAWEVINQRALRGDYGPLKFRVKRYSKVLSKLWKRMLEAREAGLIELSLDE